MKYTTIHSGFSNDRKMPILGKIRLGKSIIKQRPDGSQVEYPTETPYFVVPPDVASIYGEEPLELDVMLPSENVPAVFPQSLAMFGSSQGLKCTGDMQTASRLNDATGAWEQRSCPCEHLKSADNPKGACQERGTLMVILPKVSIGGCYQLATGSYHSVVAINSALDYIKTIIGRISMVPLKLKRTEKVGYRGSKKTHYPVSLIIDATMAEAQQLRSDSMRILSGPHVRVDEPSMDAPTVIPDDADTVETDAPALAEAPAVVAPPTSPSPAMQNILNILGGQVPTEPQAEAAFVWRIGKKHANESISTIPKEYLAWYIENGKPGDHREAAISELARRG